MTIRHDMDAAYAARRRVGLAPNRTRSVWRMGLGARHAFAACLPTAQDYLNIPIVATDEFAGIELAEVAT